MNCSQIFCTFAVETTRHPARQPAGGLWIALKFFVLLQSKQPVEWEIPRAASCELLSNFLYFCSRNNRSGWYYFQLLLWIALKFFVLLQSKQPLSVYALSIPVVNCSQIFCTFAVETTIKSVNVSILSLWIALKFFVLLQSKQLSITKWTIYYSCELLSNFLYFCSRNNVFVSLFKTLQLWIALKFFVLLQSKQLLELL